MRKELGRPTRELFFKRFREAAPDFLPSSKHQIKGFTWQFLREYPDLRQWIWFQRSKNEDAFTLELSWSQVFDDPTRPPFGSPDKPLTREGYRFRLGAFRKPAGDHWWHVAEPPSLVADALSLLRGKRAVDVEKHMPRIRAVVEDAVGLVKEHALPYLDRVAQWAGHPPQEDGGVEQRSGGG